MQINWFGIDLHQCCNLYHRNFTSAGYSASSVEKYHYPSDCHRRNRDNLLLIPGVLAVLQCRSLGVPDKVAKIIRIKVLVAPGKVLSLWMRKHWKICWGCWAVV